MFQSFLFYPEQEDTVSRPFWTLQPLCSLGHPEELCPEMLKGTEWVLSWLHAVLVGHGFLVLSPFSNKPRIQCNVKKRKTQVPRCSNSWSRRQEWIQTFFFLILWYKRNQHIYLYTVVHSGVITNTMGNTMQIPLHPMKTNPYFSFKRQSMSEWEKNQCLKNCKQVTFLDYNRCLD